MCTTLFIIKFTLVIIMTNARNIEDPKLIICMDICCTILISRFSSISIIHDDLNRRCIIILQDRILSLLCFSLLILTGKINDLFEVDYYMPIVFCNTVKAQMMTLSVVQPYGIESVDGSDINMGCTSPLVNDSDSVMVCMSQSYLVDGCSPAIDTSTSDWASQLVTMRKTQTDGFTFDHVLMTFGFDTAVTLTGIELDLFLCPDMNIDAPYISVYADEESNLVITYDSLTSLPFQNYDPSQSSCDSLSTINITLTNNPYLTWHILISSFTSSIDWVYVGEVRFLGMDDPPQMTCTTLSPTESQCSVYKVCSFILLPMLWYSTH